MVFVFIAPHMGGPTGNPSLYEYSWLFFVLFLSQLPVAGYGGWIGG